MRLTKRGQNDDLSTKTDHCPDFQRMIKDREKSLFDVVIVWKLDRFARNRYDSTHDKTVLKKSGMKVVCAKHANVEDNNGILLESLLEGYAEFYSAEHSEVVMENYCRWCYYMSDRIFYRIVAAILLIGTISSFSLVAFTIHRHNNASIITYISNER